MSQLHSLGLIAGILAPRQPMAGSHHLEPIHVSTLHRQLVQTLSLALPIVAITTKVTKDLVLAWLLLYYD